MTVAILALSWFATGLLVLRPGRYVLRWLVSVAWWLGSITACVVVAWLL